MRIVNFKESRDVCGIYAIVNKSSITPYCKEGKPYVGQSISMGNRLFSKHRSSLRSDTHINKHLQMEAQVEEWNLLKKMVIFLCCGHQLIRHLFSAGRVLLEEHLFLNLLKGGK